MSEHWKDSLGQATVLLDKVKEILSNKVPAGENGKTRPATAEERNQVEPLMEESKRLKAEALTLKKVDDLKADALKYLETQPEEDPKSEEDPKATNWSKNGDSPPDFKGWNEFLLAVWKAQNSQMTRVDPRLRYRKDDTPTEHPAPDSVKDLSGDVGASGGFLIPTEFQAQLYSLMGEQSQIRQRATIIRMTRRQIDIPVLDQTGTTSGIPHWFGGMQFYWEEEASEKTLTTAKFRKISLVAKKLIGYTRASDELLEDSAISLADFLQGPMGFSGGAIWHEEYAFLNGPGGGQPQGVINAGATIVEGRHTAGTVVFDDLADMVSDCLPGGNPIWMLSQSLMSDIIQLAGPTLHPSYIWQANARDGIPGMILGYPVLWTEKAPVKGSKGDVGLYDWKKYLIGDRQMTTVESTKFDQWKYDQTSWRMIHRVDGEPWLSAPLTYQDGQTMVSPFVVLGEVAGGS